MFIGNAFLVAFVSTLLTEVITVSFFRIRSPRSVIPLVVLINSFTHPFFVGYGIYIFGVPVVIAEFLIFMIEAIWYRLVFRISTPKAALVSFTANLVSYLFGYAIAWYML